ncbi:MAG: NB-ARC domain-containing protein [Tissierellia bacterium]|nr:NB-ARC domain-containing protein [Tissierellia bacterium]
MMLFNLSSRIVMFSICSSLEFDLKKFIISGKSVNFTKEMQQKAKLRNKNLDLSRKEEVLNELDLGDYVQLIYQNPYDYNINNEKAKLLFKYFEKIIPVRNRVMHTRPLELGDRAILTEVLDDIGNKISWLGWEETFNTKKNLEENPNKLFENGIYSLISYDNSIFHNIPIPDFDDTGYIGRMLEIKEINQLLVNKKNQIITIVGNGGIGKTAITVKTLYDLIDSKDNEYEAIIWISLKTRTLSLGEFKLIENSIKDLNDMFVNGEKYIISEGGLSPEENILNFMKEFKVLLVLDNLETINSEDIMGFLKRVPENSKVLITSRHGIGELEYRYILNGLNNNDALTYFRELSKYYGLDLYKKSDKELKSLACDNLYSNPLSIKWFITGVYNGMDINSLIAKKDELIEFCMSNVFNKLSDLSKNILQLFLIEGLELSIGEIDYFTNTDDVILRKSINELLKTNMVKLTSGNYALNEMARDYLTLFYKPSNEFMASVLFKRRELNALLQEIKVKNENEPFNPKSLFKNLKDKNRKLASCYLTRALEYSSVHDWEPAFNYIDKAANISPNYFEVYKIKAFISAEKTDFFNAMNNYQIALEKCEDNFEKATILYLFSIFFTIKLPELEKALTLINEAEVYCPNEINIILEKSRILMYLGKYDEAEDILLKISNEEKTKNKKIENIYACRYADLLRRKAQKYEMRDIEQKLIYYRKGIQKIEEVSDIDTKTYVILSTILKDLSYSYYNEEAMYLLYETLEKHFSKLKSINHINIKKIRDILINNQYEIPNNLFDAINKYIYDYKQDAKQITEEDEGIVTFIKDYYGFIANSKYSKGIYFNLNNADASIKVGSKVKFDIYNNPKGIAANNVIII